MKKWGATYPVSYAFDDYGRLTNMTTYRGGTNWFSETWPTDPGTGDSTVWLYDEATGLLTNKVYADAQGPRYTYTADGRLAARVWARGETNTYSFDPQTGDMTNIHYSATNTPDVCFSLDRIGRRKQIVDGAWAPQGQT